MTDRMENQIREIQHRTQQRRHRLENRLLSVLTGSRLFLITGIYMILERMKVPGISTVTNGYSTVLLQEDRSVYVVTAIIALYFDAGVTVLYIRYRNRQEHPENHSGKRTETLLKQGLPGESIVNSKTVTAKVENLSEVMDYIDGFLLDPVCSEKVKDQICVSVEELFTNIVSYAYPNEPSGKVVISCGTLVGSGTRMLQISPKDWGIPHNPLEQPGPNLDIPFEDRGIGGLGIYTVRQLMDQVDYCFFDGCNQVLLKKILQGGHMGRLYDIVESEANLFPKEDFEEIETGNVQINQEESEFPAEELELELENGDRLICEVVDVIFDAGHGYMMLYPTDDIEGRVHLMRMEAGEADTLKLSPTKEESELRSVIKVFQRLYENEIE